MESIILVNTNSLMGVAHCEARHVAPLPLPVATLELLSSWDTSLDPARFPCLVRRLSGVRDPRAVKEVEGVLWMSLLGVAFSYRG